MTPPYADLLSVSCVFAILAGAGLSLPPQAWCFRADGPAPEDSFSVSFVTLDAETEAFALRLAKDSLRRGPAVGLMQADLSVGDLPEEKTPPVLPIDSRSAPPALPLTEPGLSPFLPSQRAAAPEKLPQEPPEKPASAFSREDLLRLD